jgi:hypothetical protein
MHILDFVDDIKYFKSAVNLWTLIGEVWSAVNFVIRNDPSLDDPTTVKKLLSFSSDE